MTFAIWQKEKSGRKGCWMMKDYSTLEGGKNSKNF